MLITDKRLPRSPSMIVNCAALIIPLVLVLILCWEVIFQSIAIAASPKSDPDLSCFRFQLPKSILQKPFSFADEVIPLHRPDVESRILSQVNFLLLDARSVLGEWLAERSRYAWIFEEVFQREGIPREFAYLAPVLSGLTRNASRSPGAGVWVLENSCSSAEGVEMSEDNWHDDRMDLELSTRCFASRIKTLRKDITGGSWLLAAAAYVTSQKVIQDLQQRWDTNSYWDIPLPGSAEQLIVRWIAFSIISSNKEAYGLRFEVQEPFIFDQITGIVLTKDLQIAEIARMTGVSPREILSINPKIKISVPMFPAGVGGKPLTHAIAAPKGQGRLLLDKLGKAGYVVPVPSN